MRSFSSLELVLASSLLNPRRGRSVDGHAYGLPNDCLSQICSDVNTSFELSYQNKSSGEPAAFFRAVLMPEEHSAAVGLRSRTNQRTKTKQAHTSFTVSHSEGETILSAGFALQSFQRW